jgi:CBS domain-containing protein
MSLRDIASQNVVTISADATIQEAAKKMRELHVGDVIAVRIQAGQARPVGILTDRDIVVSTTALGIAPDIMLVEDIMLPELITAHSNDSLYHVLNLMKEHGIKRIPLVDENGTLEGIVTADDIVSVLAAGLSAIVQLTEKQHLLEAERRRKIA